MRPARLGVVLLLSVVLVAWASVALADGRVALVVGNSTYAHIGRLPNPANDAAAVSAALRRLGSEVTTNLDAGLTELNQALRMFTRRSAGADVALVFYAGHGLEMDGVNYVVPVDARLERDVDVRYETATLEDLVASTVGASLRLVILDACRNNPLARSMQRTVARRSVSGGSFGEFDENLLGNETLVAYAAAGTTAADGRGRNSPYTSALLSHLETPLEIGLLFRRVRAEVLEATNGEQRPHEYHSRVGEHYLTRTLPTTMSSRPSPFRSATPIEGSPSGIVDSVALPFAVPSVASHGVVGGAQRRRGAGLSNRQSHVLRVALVGAAVGATIGLGYAHALCENEAGRSCRNGRVCARFGGLWGTRRFGCRCRYRHPVAQGRSGYQSTRPPAPAES